jgi:hypothetical protein
MSKLFFSTSVVLISVFTCLTGAQAADVPTESAGGSQFYLREQPELVGFLSGGKLGPDSVMMWDVITDKIHNKQVFYKIVVHADDGTVIASSDLTENSCKLGSLENSGNLIDQKSYNLHVAAYIDTTQLPPAEKTYSYSFVFDKFPGVDSDIIKKQTGRILRPESGVGLKTKNGVLLQWEPKLKDHLWAIRVVSGRMDDTRVMRLYHKDTLEKSEFVLDETIFPPDDEDAFVEVSITSVSGVVRPIETNFRINNTNNPPGKPRIALKNGYLIQWDAPGDPDFERVGYTLAVEKVTEEGDVSIEPLKKIKISESGSLDMRKGLDRMTDYACHIIAEDSWGAVSKSKTVHINMDNPAVKPAFTLKPDFKHLSKAKYLLISHINLDQQINFNYYVKYYFENGTTYPDGKSWRTEKPSSQKRGITKIKIRKFKKRIEKIAVISQAYNKLGEKADSMQIIYGNTKKKK